jgi:putative MATE family efflux protein
MKKNRTEEFIKNPKKALFILAAPTIVGMLVQVLYSIVDTAFVGRLGVDALAALTFSWPIFFIMFAVAGGISAGMSSNISRYLGARNKKQAENVAIHGIIISLVIAIIIFILGIFYIKPFLSLLGASGLPLFLAEQYLSIILLGIFFMYISFILSSIFISQGDAKTPMIVQISSLILNIILDPIFIFKLGLGVPGAAIATVLSFLFGIILNLFFITKKSYLNINLKSFKYSFNHFKRIYKIGLPTSLAMILMSFSFMVLNKFMSTFSTEHIAMLGIIARIESTIMMPISGLAMASMTLAGIYYGAKRYDLLKQITWYSIKIGIIFTTISGIILFIFPKIFIRIFTNDNNLINLAIPYLRFDVFDFWMISIGIIASRIMRGIGYGLPGLLMVIIRVLFVLLPLSFLFVFVFNLGYLSLVIAVLLSGAIYSISGLIWIKHYFKKFNTNIIENEKI